MEVVYSKGKEKEAHMEFKTPLYQMTEEESKYITTT